MTSPNQFQQFFVLKSSSIQPVRGPQARSWREVCRKKKKEEGGLKVRKTREIDSHSSSKQSSKNEKYLDTLILLLGSLGRTTLSHQESCTVILVKYAFSKKRSQTPKSRRKILQKGSQKKKKEVGGRFSCTEDSYRWEFGARKKKTVTAQVTKCSVPRLLKDAS